MLLGTNLTSKQIQIVSDVKPNLVVLDSCFETMDVNFVVMNNLIGAYQAAQHLINLGHKDIGYVESDTRMCNFDMRKKGFFQTINEANLTVSKDNFFQLSPTVISTQEDFKEKIEKRMGHLPTALFCECDYIAISVIKTFLELGIKIPEDISIVGFDNIFESQVIIPELTTINVKKDKIALLAVEKLIRMIDKNETDKIKLFVDTELTDRSSCRIHPQ